MPSYAITRTRRRFIFSSCHFSRNEFENRSFNWLNIAVSYFAILFPSFSDVVASKSIFIDLVSFQRFSPSGMMEKRPILFHIFYLF